MISAESAPEWLFDDLTIEQRRRLYLLLLVMRQPGDCLAASLIATTNDCLRFVTAPPETETKFQSSSGSSQDRAEAPAYHGNAQVIPTPSTVITPPQSISRDSISTHRSPPGVLNQEQRKEFESDVSAGYSNQQLAAKFGLTGRQAHGLRIGYARARVKMNREAGGLPLETVSDNDPEPGIQNSDIISDGINCDHALEEVVRFLRQCDDVVIRRDGGFLVNARFQLDARDLVERANRKRRERGKELFDLPPPEQHRGSVLLGKI